MERNGAAIAANPGPGAGSGVMSIQVRDSLTAGNEFGIIAFTPAGAQTVSIAVDQTLSNLNDEGVTAEGPTSFVLIGSSAAVSNNKGLVARSGGSIFSYQNNHLSGNVTDGGCGI
jgi:hypothetical protein